MKALAAAPGTPKDPLARRALAQAGRELLLAQASDWPFILRQHTSTGYARRRVREHLDRFDRLASGLEAGAPDAALVAELEQRDNLFPDLDPGVWRAA
jgi:1,4-alpha-glucan branching enzyme